MSNTHRIIAIIGLAFCATSQATQAQVVTGQVVDSLSQTPLSGGFVVLLDESGAEVARTLTGPTGDFRLRAPRSGSYRLRSERIGYRLAESPRFVIAARSTVSYTLEIAPVPFVLRTVEVRSETECEVNPERAVATAVVWEEVRKALAATAWDGTQELARYRLYNYERDLSGNRRRVTRESAEVVAGVAIHAYSSLPAARLSREGYIATVENGGLQYAIPDANVLLHDSFLSTHCFHVVRDATKRPGQVGLAFVPVKDRRVTDVRGALWLDETTSELRTLDASYTRLPADLEDERAGGTVEFLRLPSGAWIVQRWELRTPIVRVQRQRASLSDRSDVTRTWVAGWRDFGGEVLEVSTADDLTIHPASLAHVTGTVYDSTRAGPLAGVTVALAGTEFSSTTDTAGAFHIAVPLEGEYAITVSHPWLDSIAYRTEAMADLARRTTRTVDIHVAHARNWLAHICPDAPDSVETGAVVGAVLKPGGRSLAAKATVTALWQTIIARGRTYVGVDWEATATTDEAGRYVLCQIPAGRAVRIFAALDGDTSGTAHAILPTSDGRELLFAWNRRRGEGYQSHVAREHSIWTVNFTLGQRSPIPLTDTGTWLSGRVTDETIGRGIDGVTVVLNSGDTTTTRTDGTFDLQGVEFASGVNIVTFHRLGFRPHVQGFAVGEQQDGLDLNVSLQAQALTLEPVEVTAEAVDRYLDQVGFHDRQRVNRGYFVDRSGVERLLGRVSSVVEMVATLPSMGRLGCARPLVFIDGFRLDTGFGISTAIRPEDVHAIEVYRTPSQVPPQFGGAESGCGVIVIWTRRGG